MWAGDKARAHGMRAQGDDKARARDMRARAGGMARAHDKKMWAGHKARAHDMRAQEDGRARAWHDTTAPVGGKARAGRNHCTDLKYIDVVYHQKYL